MYCRNCGAELRPEEKFCPNCGTELLQRAATEVTDSGMSFSQLPRPKNFKEFVKRTDCCSPDVRKEIKGCWILLFVFAAVSAAYAIVNDVLPIDGIILALIALWMMLTYSLASSIAANVFALASVVLGVIQTGEFRGYLLLIASVFSLIYIIKGRKQYNMYLASGTTASPLGEPVQRRGMLDDPKL